MVGYKTARVMVITRSSVLLTIDPSLCIGLCELATFQADCYLLTASCFTSCMRSPLLISIPILESLLAQDQIPIPSASMLSSMGSINKPITSQPYRGR